jgi:type IX secretion system PorP/SprF family membrane protein
MKKILSNMKTGMILLLMTIAAHNAFGQANNSFTQYFQVPNLFNPAFAGLQNYTDIKAGSRLQWTSFDASPKSYLLNISHPVRFRSGGYTQDAADSVSGNKPGVSAGISGSLIQKDMGGYSDLEASLSYAAHVPVSSRYRLSFGLTTAYSRIKADLNKFIIRDETDLFYQSIISANGAVRYFTINAGILLSSDRFMAGYSALRLSSTRLDLNEDVDSEDNLNVRHQGIVAYNHELTPEWEIISSALYRYDELTGSSVGLNVKARYRSQCWAGLGVTPNESFSALIGFTFQNNISFGYSYEINVTDVKNYAPSAHEVMIGFAAFNKRKQRPMLW